MNPKKRLSKKVGLPLFLVVVILTLLLISHQIELPYSLNFIALPFTTCILLIIIVLISDPE